MKLSIDDTLPTRRAGNRLGTVLVAVIGATIALFVGAGSGTASSTHVAGAKPLRSFATGRCLDSNRAGRAYTLPCNGGNYQRWYPSGTSMEWVIHNNQTGLCLASNKPGAVYTTRCSNRSLGDNDTMRWYQNFYVRPGGRVVRHYQNLRTGQCLDSTASGVAYTRPCGTVHEDWHW